MPAKTVLLVALSLCLWGTSRTAQAEVIASWHAPNSTGARNGDVPANLNGQSGRSTGLRLDGFAPVPAGKYFFSNNSAPQSAVLTGTALAVDVPELATWAMMLAGLGAIGTGLRMRRGKRPVTLEVFRRSDRRGREIPSLH